MPIEPNVKPKYKRQTSSSRKFDRPSTILCACGCKTEIEEYDRFGRVRKYVSGHNTRKYDDPTQFKREWNHRNREARYAAKTRFRYRRRVQLITMLGGKCLDCDTEYNGKNGAIFHLHHEDAATKSFEIGPALTNRKWSEVEMEAKKCVLLCGNCHTMRHSPPY